MIITGRHLMAIPLLLVLAAGSGCKKGFANLPAKLHGKITYKNAPVTGGVIILYGADDGAYNVVIQNDGTFSQADLPAEQVRVPASAFLLKRLALIKVTRSGETAVLKLTDKGIAVVSGGKANPPSTRDDAAPRRTR